jgi:hypothetical protein
MKIFKKGNYIYIVNDNGDIKQDHANEVKITKSNVSNEKYTIYSDDLGLNEVEFSEIKKEDGNAYASVSAWELFYAENTGFNTAAGGSVAVYAKFANFASLPTTGSSFSLYLTIDKKKLYEWDGSQYNEVSPTVIKDDLYQVANYSALPSASTYTNDIVWVSNSQGSKWLPGSLGGTYYPNGLYYSNGTSWEYQETPYNATQSEVNTGTNNDKFVTPLTFANATKWNSLVPYTGATTDVDLGANELNVESIKITGQSGLGHLHLRRQSSNPTASANNTAIFADVNGDIKYKNDNQYYTTLKTSLNTADRTYTFPNRTGTIADDTDLATKQNTITGGATTIVSSNLTVSKALTSDASGKVATSATTSTELGHLSGVTSAVQTQINSKEPTIIAGTSTQYWRGDKTFQTLNTTAVTEGTNLYLTEPRVRGTVLTGFVSGAGTLTATDTVLSAVNKLDGNIGTKQATITGAASSVVSTNFNANVAVVTDASGKLSQITGVSSTEIGYLDGVTSAIQTQINGKEATITGGATTITGSNLTASRMLVSDALGKVAVSSVTSTEAGYLSGVTSTIQTQLNSKGTVQTAGNSGTGAVFYNGVSKSSGSFDGGTVAPTNVTRLNYDGYLYATRFYGDGSQLTNLPAGAWSGGTVNAKVAITPSTVGVSDTLLAITSNNNNPKYLTLGRSDLTGVTSSAVYFDETTRNWRFEHRPKFGSSISLDEGNAPDFVRGLGWTAGNTQVGFVGYNGTTKLGGYFYGGTTDPTSTAARLNFDGNMYATRFYGDASNLTNLTPGDSTVTTNKLANNAVTNAKLAQVATQTFRGRNTAGTGNVEDLSVATVKTMLGLNNNNRLFRYTNLSSNSNFYADSLGIAFGLDASGYFRMSNVTATYGTGRSISTCVYGRETAGTTSGYPIAGAGAVVKGGWNVLSSGVTSTVGTVIISTDFDDFACYDVFYNDNSISRAFRITIHGGGTGHGKVAIVEELFNV